MLTTCVHTLKSCYPWTLSTKSLNLPSWKTLLCGPVFSSEIMQWEVLFHSTPLHAGTLKHFSDFNESRANVSIDRLKRAFTDAHTRSTHTHTFRIISRLPAVVVVPIGPRDCVNLLLNELALSACYCLAFFLMHPCFLFPPFECLLPFHACNVFSFCLF